MNVRFTTTGNPSFIVSYVRVILCDLEVLTLVFLQLNPADKKNWQEGELVNALTEAEGVINLAGEPIADKRWTPTHCQTLESSRINTTNELVNAMIQLKRGPRVFVNASAIGYYGTSQENTFTEESPSGHDFLANICKRWETTATQKPAAQWP